MSLVVRLTRSALALWACFFLMAGIGSLGFAPDDAATLTVGKDFEHNRFVVLFNRDFDFPTGEAFVIDIPVAWLVTVGCAAFLSGLHIWQRR
jgi:hypothetical protein